MGGAIYGQLKAEDVELTGRLGLPGLEPYRGSLTSWLDRPGELKAVLDRNKVRLITCSNGGAGQETNFIDPTTRTKAISDHVAFARDFLKLFGCTWFKINMGARPAGGTRQADIRALADALNELGQRTLEIGIKLAAHPHIWGPIERPEEVDRLLELTDPAALWWIPDTAQLNLGGGDPLDLMRRHYDRMVAVHWKDSKASYRGYTGPTPTRESHNQEILYKDLGAGGCDIPGIWQLLLDRGYQGWVTLDLDPPRANEGEGSPEDKARINVRYLLETLKVGTL
jgi:sugar phosphate isomerase/epimerase